MEKYISKNNLVSHSGKTYFNNNLSLQDSYKTSKITFGTIIQL